jgi:hypothetical protein
MNERKTGESEWPNASATTDRWGGVGGAVVKRNVRPHVTVIKHFGEFVIRAEENHEDNFFVFVTIGC